MFWIHKCVATCGIRNHAFLMICASHGDERRKRKCVCQLSLQRWVDDCVIGWLDGRIGSCWEKNQDTERWYTVESDRGVRRSYPLRVNCHKMYSMMSVQLTGKGFLAADESAGPWLRAGHAEAAKIPDARRLDGLFHSIDSIVNYGLKFYLCDVVWCSSLFDNMSARLLTCERRIVFFWDSFCSFCSSCSRERIQGCDWEPCCLSSDVFLHARLERTHQWCDSSLGDSLPGRCHWQTYGGHHQGQWHDPWDQSGQRVQQERHVGNCIWSSWPPRGCYTGIGRFAAKVRTSLRERSSFCQVAQRVAVRPCKGFAKWPCNCRHCAHFGPLCVHLSEWAISSHRWAWNRSQRSLQIGFAALLNFLEFWSDFAWFSRP